jgi:zinc transport system permease protein
MRWAVLIGAVCSVAGVVVSYEADTPSGGTIVVLAIAVFVAASVTRTAVTSVRARRHARAEVHPHEHGLECGHPAVIHGGHVDYLHDGHRHAPHEGHYDEHALGVTASAPEPTVTRARQP